MNINLKISVKDYILESILNIFLVSLVFFTIIFFGYGFSYAIFSTLVFFLSIFLPYLLMIHFTKREIIILFVPFILKKINKKNLKKLYYFENYKKSFPCWLICSLVFSALTFFKIPIIFIGTFIYFLWQIPIKVYDDNSEIETIKDLFFYFFIFQILLAIILIIKPELAIIPLLVAFYMIIPIPGNLGLDLYILDFKRWVISFILVLISLIIFIIILVVYKVFEFVSLNNTYSYF